MTAAVLVVEADEELRDRLGDWLEEAGYEVLTCPGPTAPDYTCVAGRGQPCVLVVPADVVVLDLWLGPDTAMTGTRSEELLDYYGAVGKPVVTISHRRDAATMPIEGPRTHLAWPPERQGVLKAVRSLVRSRSVPAD